MNRSDHVRIRWQMVVMLVSPAAEPHPLGATAPVEKHDNVVAMTFDNWARVSPFFTRC
ncbi:hypothetical protein ACO2I3_20800 [Leptospira interrogans]